jgi:hypothetical protein
MTNPTSAVPQQEFWNEFGQKIIVRLIAGKIMVCHEGIHHKETPTEDPPKEKAEVFFEYIPSQVEYLPESSIESDTLEPEKSAFDLVSPPRKAPRTYRINKIPDDSPQNQLTDEERQLIEYHAGILIHSSVENSSKWFESIPEDKKPEVE